MNGPMGSNVIGYRSEDQTLSIGHQQGQGAFDQGGFSNGLETKLYFSPDRYPKAKEVCQVIADQLAKVGIKAELVSQEFVIFWGKEGVNGGKLRFYYVGRPAAMPTPCTINIFVPV